MDTIKLNFKEGGIFPETKPEDRTRELRARAALAYGFQYASAADGFQKGGFLNIHTVKNRSHILTTMYRGPFERFDNETLFTIQQPVNSGLIYLADSNAGWSGQPTRLFLFTDVNTDVEAAIHLYFAPSFRWLSDNANQQAAIARSFEGQDA